ncbi:MAG: hypothetical protein A2512_06450 [Deltaproteobacteria bacterium RIFOXYD12_FULL_56_24]|nr:MAG: hypothetical protein A2512_06450 [Deltaproteobacteria bacterium RIFOXYD12_FULL_56_24]
MTDQNLEGRLQHTIAGLTHRIALLEAALREKKNIDLALRESETRYRRLFESAKDGILILDADTGKVVDANPFLTELLGLSHSDLCGQYLWELGVFKDIAASKEAFRSLQDKEYIRYDDLPLETRDGRPIAVEFVSNVYLIDQHRVIQCNIRDITAQKRDQAERLQLAAQLQQTQKMESVGRLAGGVAHEYNNMLSVILGHAELALEKVDPSQPIYTDLRKIFKAGRRAADVTKQLLAFAREQAIIPVQLDMNQAVESMLNMLKRLIGEEIELSFRSEESTWPVQLDPVQFGQILINLCVNAMDAISGSGKIVIATGNTTFDEKYCHSHPGFEPGEYAMLSVSDDGCGIDRKILDQIFEPFFSSKEIGNGTGLGLSIIYGIVKQNHGFIDLVSEPGHGANFTIYFRKDSGQQTGALPC